MSPTSMEDMWKLLASQQWAENERRMHDVYSNLRGGLYETFSPYYNEKTIPGEVVEDDEYTTGHRGTDYAAPYFPRIPRLRRHVPEYTILTGGKCRCPICRWTYGRPPSTYQGVPRFSYIPEAREATIGSPGKLSQYRLRENLGGYRFQDRDFSAYDYDWNTYEFRIVPRRSGKSIVIKDITT